MITYRDAVRRERTRSARQRLSRHAAAGDATAYLVALGELEQGLVDALRPERDGWSPTEARLREAALHAAAAFRAGRGGSDPLPLLRHAEASLASLPDRLPEEIEIRAPEGYVHYALDPAAYAAAAERYARAHPERARRTVVVGVRSIGTSLSAVVADTVGTDRSCTLRPRGESGSRHIAADASLMKRLAELLRGEPEVLIVDEGPGATGETFASVAAWFRVQAVPEERIVLFPSHGGGMALAPEERRDWFLRARKELPPVGDDRPVRIAEALGLSEPRDLSAGKWRAHVAGAEGAPASVGHERSKYLARDAEGNGWLLRYVGLGWWGEAAVERARALAEHGVGAPVRAYHEGFLVRPWVEGRIASRDDLADPAFLSAVTRYLAARAGTFRTGSPVDRGPLLEMLQQNAREALGDGVEGLDAACRVLERLPEREAVIADARMQLREWIRTPEGYRKVDTLDHGDGTRLPGPTDAAWDLAAAAVEYGLTEETLEELVGACAVADESMKELTAAVAAYRPVYAAAALGEADLAAREAWDDAERGRLRAERERYGAALSRLLGGA